MTRILMIYADKEVAKICANHKKNRVICALKTQIAAFVRAEHRQKMRAIRIRGQKISCKFVQFVDKKKFANS
ncbi:MAG: hypothetical protein LBG47_05650 [Prevotellaceae bacterium]|jgi:hypothetical protein|nr:hypothetical protein [Prevotellaceae bacterium]